MFVPDDYSNYFYVVSLHDNYITLTNRSHVNASYQNPQTINVIHQYLIPSIVTIESTQTITSDRYFDEIDIGHDFYDRADCPQLVSCSILLTFFLLFILNGITKLFKRGGIFFGS